SLARLGITLQTQTLHQTRPHPAPLPRRNPHRHPPRPDQRPPRRTAQQNPPALPPQLRIPHTPSTHRAHLPLLRRNHHHPTPPMSHSNQRSTPKRCAIPRNRLSPSAGQHRPRELDLLGQTPGEAELGIVANLVEVLVNVLGRGWLVRDP